VAIRNVAQASANLAAMRSSPEEPDLMSATTAGDEARARAGRYIQNAMQREWRSFGIHLGAVYGGSPIICAEETDLPDDDIAAYVQRALPGYRAPHAWLEPGRSTLDLFGRSFVLLDLAGDDGTLAEPLLHAAAALGVPVVREALNKAEVAAIYGCKLVLVRPDGYIAWRGDAPPADPAGVIDCIRGAATRPATTS
jgi:hypothetical protein